MNANTLKRFFVGISLVTVSIAVAAVNIPNTFTAGQPIKAAEVNANFSSLKTAVDSLEGKTTKLVQSGNQLTVSSDVSVTGRVLFKSLRVDADSSSGQIFAAFAPDGTGAVSISTSGDIAAVGNISTSKVLQGEGLSVSNGVISDRLNVGSLYAVSGMTVKPGPGNDRIFNALADDGTGLVTMFGSGDLVVARDIIAGNVMKAKAFNVTSDRNAKKNFSSVNPLNILEKVVNMPISSWNYKTDADNLRHIGPMAQDFHATFGLNGSDDKHISMVDQGGVALAAVQGLNQKLEAENAALKARLDALEARLNALEAR